MNKIKWLFFDVGSTLVDESKVYERRFEKIAQEAGVSVQSITDKAFQNMKYYTKIRKKY